MSESKYKINKLINKATIAKLVIVKADLGEIYFGCVELLPG